MIKIEQLTKIYKTKVADVQALSNVNLLIKQEEIFGVIGMSGAGKSTFLRCLGLLEKPTSGKVFVNDVDIYTLSGKEKRKMHQDISIIFQGYQLLMQRNVRENVALPLELNHESKEQVKQKVADMIALVGLEGKEEMYPSQLSGGQKQRVAIARALVTNPKLLLCDEPTSALDSLTTKSVLQLLKKINKEFGVTIMIITHEIGVVKAICDRVAVIDKSKIVEEGKTDEVFGSPKADITKLLLGMGGEDA